MSHPLLRRPLLAFLMLAVACAAPSAAPNTTTATAATVDSTTVPSPGAADPAPPGPTSSARVVHVSDGDSLIVEIDGAEERVRLIGINSPERGECYAEEATAALEELVSGRTLDLATDVEPADQYGRILAYAYLDGLLVNAELVRRGAALARPYEPNTTLQSHLDAAEVDAVAARAGMWSADTCGESSDPEVVISRLTADAPGPDGENLNGEWIELTNLTDGTVDLAGWTIHDESSVHRYEFGPTRLEPGGSITVYTGCGDDTGTSRHWCATSPVWDNGGDAATLSRPDGTVEDRLSYSG